MKSLVSICILIVLWAAAVVFSTTWADDDPPKTTLTECAGSLPSLSLLGNSDCHDVVITATDPADAQLIGYWPHSFSHEYYVSGDPACVFTAKPRHDLKTHIRDGIRMVPVPDTVEGGRNCRPGVTQCAYISEGYYTFAITGQDCTEAGVGVCGGPWCV